MVISDDQSTLTLLSASFTLISVLPLRSPDEMAGPGESVRVLQGIVERAVSLRETNATVQAIRRDLAEAIGSDQVRLPGRFCQIKPGCYARRLLLRDVAMGYSIVIMTWAPGQTTPIHDHAGLWCVEGVIQGEISVTRYRVEGGHNDGQLLLFSEQAPIRARVGSTGCLIPPDEYHVMANRADSTAVTLHVYGGEMDHCNVYVRRPDGWYKRIAHALGYDPI